MPSQRFVVVVGCGRLGALLADRISSQGDSVVVVDREEDAFSLLAPDYTGFKVEGDATEVEVLRRANVEKADIVIAATNGDNVNILISLAARNLSGVPRVLARISNMRRQAFYGRLGVEALSPTAIVAEYFLDQIDGRRDA